MLTNPPVSLHRGPNFTLRDRGVNARLAKCLNSVLNVKALVGASNQEKALVGAFSVIVQLAVEPMDRFVALLQTPALYPTLHWAGDAGEVSYVFGLFHLLVQHSYEDCRTKSTINSNNCLRKHLHKLIPPVVFSASFFCLFGCESSPISRNVH